MKINDVVQLINCIPISSVLEEWEPSTLEGRCCFHDDKEAGSFHYKDDDKKGGIFTCFCCGVKGDKIDFVCKHDGVDFKEAVLRIAYKFGKISEDDYKALSVNPTTQKIIQVQAKTIKKVEEAEKLPDWYLDILYRDMKEVCGLSQEHKNYLLGRGVSEDDLINYFTMPEFNKNFFEKMAAKKYKPRDFIGVPGFYIQDGKIAAKQLEGIGIPMVDADGLVTAIQIRKDKVEGKDARYLFFSSTGKTKGCSCGAQVDIQLPEEPGSVFITEGHFKAVEMSKFFKATCISVQGVNNTKELDSEIPRLLEKRSIRRFIIAFDADMIHNPSVKKAARKLKIQLEKFNIPTGYLVWDEKYGKGADDVILNGNAKYFKATRELEGD